MAAKPPPIDIDSGLLSYSTAGPRHEGRLRTTFKDFQVEELTDVTPSPAGPFALYRSGSTQ